MAYYCATFSLQEVRSKPGLSNWFQLHSPSKRNENHCIIFRIKSSSIQRNLSDLIMDYGRFFDGFYNFLRRFGTFKTSLM